ncbi:MAG TPA: DUF697 domain-containing protein [Polyangiaceae bacterium]|jgi:uncharacterized protein (DUF697 family)|nr:DUF697 domain-containing protein [Polyangiaceae bacterium]
MGTLETIARVMHGNFENATDAEKLAAVRDVTVACSVAAAAITVQPVPLLDIALLAPVHVGMVQAIGQVHGHKLDAKSVVEMLATFGGTIVTRSILGSVVKVIPVFGWAASASMAYAMTYAIGEVSHCYFASGRGLSSTQLRSMFRSVYDAKRTEKAAAAQANETLKEKLRQITDAYEAGLLTAEEYREKKEQVLKEL